MLVRGRLFAPEPRGHVIVTVTGGRINAIDPVADDAPAPEGALGGPDATICPGLIDIQVNGAFGEDFSDPAADVHRVSAGLPAFGVTAYLACVITSPLERYGPCLANVAAATSGPDGEPGAASGEGGGPGAEEEPGSTGGARLLGVHMEGPFLSPERPGTHESAWLREPSVALAGTWLACGAVRLMTLAPELPGALDLVRWLTARGVVVSMGHTNATWAEAQEAAEAGATLGTHLFNAMRPLDHHEPGVAGYLLSSDLAVSVIADGVHLDMPMLKLVARLKRPDRLVVVTDALSALGAVAGDFELAGGRIVSDGVVGRRADGTMSGSLLPLNRALGILVRAGVAAEDAVRAATLNPARLLHLDDRLGAVEPGRTADLCVLDPDWRVLHTLVGGRRVYSAPIEKAGDALEAQA